MGQKKYYEDEYEPIRQRIKALFYDTPDYDKCLKETKDFLYMIKEDKASNYNFYWTYMMFSKLYNKLGNKKATLDNLLNAEKYLDKNIKTLWIVLRWQLGMYFKELNYKKALKYFHEAYEISREEKNYKFMGGLLDEIALIDKDIDEMLCAIDFYSMCNESPLCKINNLNSMYGHLFELYLYHNMELQAYQTLHKISDKDLVDELKERLNAYRLA